MEATGFLDGIGFLVRVDHEQEVGKIAHVLDAAEVAVETLTLTVEEQALLLGHAFGFGAFEHAQARDRLRNGLPIGERATEPARIDEILRRLAGSFGNERRGLALGAHEQHATAVSDSVGHELERALQQRHGLAEIEDVDVVAHAEDVAFHLGVPAVRLVTEVDAGFEQLTHGKVWDGHRLWFPLPVEPP